MIQIVTNHFKEDLEWLKTSKYPVVVIEKEGADPSCITPQHIMPNRGRETSSYIKYIIENYDKLPEHVAFIHGHEKSHHQRHTHHLFDVIDGANVTEYGFISLNNLYTAYPFADEDMSLPSGLMEIKKFWDKFEMPMKKPPHYFTIHVALGAQFIVSKERILKHPKTLYERWYSIIMEEAENKQWPHCFEATWHIIFGEFWQDAQCDEWFKFKHTRIWTRTI